MEDRYRHLLALRHMDAPSRARAAAEKQHDAEVDAAEEYVTMKEFANGEEEVISSEKPVGHDSQATANLHLHVENRALAPRVQVAMFLALDALNDMFMAGCCPSNLSAANITLSRASMTPKFVGLQFVKVSPEGVQDCMTRLATVFREDLLLGLPLPLEVRHLFVVMRNDAADLLPLVLYHPSLAPMENRCDYFDRMYGYVRYVLQPKHEVAYEFILGNAIFPDDWDAQLKSNTYLHRFYCSAPASARYFPQGKGTQAQAQMTDEQKTAAKKEAAEEVLRYNHDFPAHGLREAAHAPSPDGMIFNRTGMARMLYSVFDGVMVSVAECLARVGHFGSLHLESLFPGRVEP